MTHTTTVDVDRLVERYLAVWREPDATARSRGVAELWATDGAEYVEGVQFRGHDGLTDRVAEAYQQFVATGAYQLTHEDHVTVHGDIVVLTLQLIHAEGEHKGELAWSARAFLVLDEDGRIRQDYHVTVQPLQQ
jgi:hypothetical protein